MKKRIFYSFEEDMKILDYLIRNKKVLFASGNEIWEEMAIKKITIHTAQSMRAHFLKVIMKNLQKYPLTKNDMDKFIENSQTYHLSNKIAQPLNIVNNKSFTSPSCEKLNIDTENLTHNSSINDEDRIDDINNTMESQIFDTAQSHLPFSEQWADSMPQSGNSFMNTPITKSTIKEMTTTTSFGLENARPTSGKQELTNMIKDMIKNIENDNEVSQDDNIDHNENIYTANTNKQNSETPSLIITPRILDHQDTNGPSLRSNKALKTPTEVVSCCHHEQIHNYHYSSKKIKQLPTYTHNPFPAGLFDQLNSHGPSNSTADNSSEITSDFDKAQKFEIIDEMRLRYKITPREMIEYLVDRCRN